MSIGSIEDLKIFIKKEINNAKRSILYDLEQKINTIKIEISRRTEEIAPLDPWTIVGEFLPAMEINKFLEFNEMLTTDSEKQEALKLIFRLETIGSKNYEADITEILKKLIGKDVQLLYSGCCRMVNGVGKKNFSATRFYKIMNDFILSKYSQSMEKLKVIHVTSKFLSGAKDREGGRSQRSKKD
ncbi:hypothetical protein PV327_007343 [Microctonus hyperodae]|uniref:DUF4806 domain-containing protein n=1 Tax=Microctonus hyperodae TaxID=165561 RepID=A0AA39KYL5_MICHY|nr:hypothetical protein PV327_007343 [Microctonus hyperodae]